MVDAATSPDAATMPRTGRIVAMARLAARTLKPTFFAEWVILGRQAPGRSGHQQRRVTPNALPVAPLEQVPGSCLEALRAEHLEAEGVGEPTGRVERDADRQRVFDLLA